MAAAVVLPVRLSLFDVIFLSPERKVFHVATCEACRVTTDVLGTEMFCSTPLLSAVDNLKFNVL